MYQLVMVSMVDYGYTKDEIGGALVNTFWWKSLVLATLIEPVPPDRVRAGAAADREGSCRSCAAAHAAVAAVDARGRE